MKSYITGVLLFLYMGSTAILMAQQTRLVIDPQAHSGIVNKLLFTSDGRFLISASDDKTIRVWDVQNQKLDRTIRPFAGKGANGAIYAMALSPDNRFLAIGGYFPENEIRIIDITKTAPVVLLKSHDNVVTDLTFSSNGLLLASADASGKVKLWDISYKTGRIQGKFNRDLKGHTAQVYSIALAPDGKQLVSASYDGSLRLWNLEEEAGTVVMKMHIDKVTACAFSANGDYIISGGSKGKLILWDKNGTFKSFITSLDEPVRSISVHGNTLLIGATKVYQLELPSTQHQLLAAPFKGVSATAISSSGIAALAGGASGTIILYNLLNATPLKLFRSAAALPKQVAFTTKNTLAFAYKKDSFATGYDLNNLKYVWKIDTKENTQTDRHEESGYKLQKYDAYTLSTGFSGKVEMNPKLDGRIRSYTIIDENLIAVGGDFSLKIYDRKGNYKRNLMGVNGAITSLATYQDRIAAVCADQTIKIWNIHSGELLCSLFISAKKDWICWTPQGFYQASAGGEKFIGWQVDSSPEKLSKFYKSSVFASKYHNPATVIETLRMGNFTMAKEKMEKEEGTPEKIESIEAEKLVEQAPEINWIEPQLIETSLDNPKITIKAIVKSSSKIKTVKILVNGRPASNSRGVAVPKSVGEFDIMVEQELVLNNSINEVRIFVSNQEAKKVSEKRVLLLSNIDKRGEGRNLQVINYSDRPDLYILSIGISKYANDEYDLNYADNDAQAITEAFTSLGTNVYKDVIPVQLLNKQATKNNIINALDDLSQKVVAKDMVLIFIASHGINEKGAFYLLPHDTDLLQHPENLVGWDDIINSLSRLPSKVLVLVDACHSGQLGADLSEYKANTTEAIRNASNDENGLVLMAAATGSESALETPKWNHGAFTLAVLEGIKEGKADIKPDGTIYLRELDFYVSERTIELTDNAQHPTTQKPSTISRLSIMNLNK